MGVLFYKQLHALSVDRGTARSLVGLRAPGGRRLQHNSHLLCEQLGARCADPPVHAGQEHPWQEHPCRVLGVSTGALGLLFRVVEL